jgi:glycosyltransferase involved in cell wall biosynthesis
LGQDARPGNKYISKINPIAAELIALSDFIADEFERNYGIRPANIIPPGIDDNQFKRKTSERRIDILAAGSLIPLKRYDLLIEIVAGIRKQIPDIRVELCGAGPEQTRLVGMIHSLGLEDNITLTGELPHEILLERMQQCKLFLHPSTYEGFGIVCLEALHAGATVISFVQPMKQEIGKWMIALDKNDIINKSVDILRNPSISYTSITPFTIQQTASSIAALFPEIPVTAIGLTGYGSSNN